MTAMKCPNCGAVFPLPDHQLGKRLKCKICNKAFDAQPVQKNTSLMPIDGWYYVQDKKKIGPVPLSQLLQLQSEGVLKPEDMVLQEGTRQWRPLATAMCAAAGSDAQPVQKNIVPSPPPRPGNDIPTVVARRSGPAPKVSHRMHAGWLVGSFAALVVPILTASALTVWRPAWRGLNPNPNPNLNPKIAYAGIEIGSNGPRYCLVEFLPVTKGGDNFRVVTNEQTNARLTSGMDKTGNFDQVEFRKTMNAVQTFHNRLVKEHGIPPEQIVIVSSDGLFGPIARRQDIDQHEKDRLIEQCRDALSAAVKKATGRTMEFVNRTRFAEHELRAAVRKSDLKDAVFLDIGGGSTRGAYCDAADVIQAAEGPGIQSFMGRVNDGLTEDDKFAERAVALAEQHLREPFRTGLGKDPEFAARGKIYLAGGIAWVMANCQHPGDTEDYVRLSAGDIEAFTAKVRASPELLTKIRPDPSLSPERQEWLKREYARMRSAFKAPERLVAGAEILLALSTELQFAGREIWFYRHSDFAWVASYIEETRRPRK
jgi:predicted Zn finger-like uncharacterized protein